MVLDDAPALPEEDARFPDAGASGTACAVGAGIFVIFCAAKVGGVRGVIQAHGSEGARAKGLVRAGRYPHGRSKALCLQRAHLRVLEQHIDQAVERCSEQEQCPPRVHVAGCQQTDELVDLRRVDASTLEVHHELRDQGLGIRRGVRSLSQNAVRAAGAGHLSAQRVQRFDCATQI